MKVYFTLIFVTYVDICGVTGKRRTSDLNVTDARPPLVTIHIRCKLLINSTNKFNFNFVAIDLFV